MIDRRFAVILFLVVSLVGCATLEPPEVTLVNMSITDITVLETSGTVTLRLSNANPEALQIDGAAFDLYLDGRKVGRALSDETLDVPRLATATMVAQLHLSHIAVATRLQSILEAEELDYRLRGKVWTVGDLGRRALRVERSGTVDLGDLDGLDDVDVDVGTGDSGGGASGGHDLS